MGLFNSNQAEVVYVSYIPDDIYYASAVVDHLREAGYNVVATPYQMNYESQKKLDVVCAQLAESVDIVVSISSPTASRSPRFWSDMANARLSETPVVPFVVHDFVDGVPMKHYISATDDIEHGCKRLQAALKRANAYCNNRLPQEQPVLKRVVRAAVATVAVAMFALIAALFSS